MCTQDISRDGIETYALFDAHVHINFAEDPNFLARELKACKIAALSMGIRPHDYARQVETAAESAYIVPAVGMHPWLISDGSIDTQEFQQGLRYIEQAVLIGEVGLDFSSGVVGRDLAYAEHKKQEQIACFRAVCEKCVEAAARDAHKRILSIHCVSASKAMIDMLQRTCALSHCLCIFHGYCGSGDDLVELRKQGALFSIGQKMLASKRGKAYAAQIPLAHTLVETDLPNTQGLPLTAREIQDSLQQTMHELAAIHHCEVETLREHIRAQEALIISSLHDLS